MRTSFDGEESFQGAIESLRFNNPPSDPNAQQQMGSNNSVPLEDSEWNEDNIISNDPVTTTLRRVGSSSSLSIQETRRNGDVQVSFNNPPSNPKCTGAVTSANGMPA